MAARLPEAMRLPEGGPGKWILRRLMAQVFPEAGTRPKKGFPVPLATWMRGPLLKEAVAGTVFASDSKPYAPRSTASRPCWGRGRLCSKATDAPAQAFYALWLYEVWAAQVA